MPRCSIPLTVGPHVHRRFAVDALRFETVMVNACIVAMLSHVRVSERRPLLAQEMDRWCR